MRTWCRSQAAATRFRVLIARASRCVTLADCSDREPPPREAGSKADAVPEITRASDPGGAMALSGNAQPMTKLEISQMFVRKSIATVAVVATALLSGAAFADVMVGGQAMYAGQEHHPERRQLGRSHHARRRGEGRRPRRHAVRAPARSRCSRRPTPRSRSCPPAPSTRCSSPRTRCTLTKVLTYHVVPGRVTTADLKKMIKAGHGKARAQDRQRRHAVGDDERRRQHHHQGCDRRRRQHQRLRRDPIERHHPFDRSRSDAEVRLHCSSPGRSASLRTAQPTVRRTTATNSSISLSPIANEQTSRMTGVSLSGPHG